MAKVDPLTPRGAHQRPLPQPHLKTTPLLPSPYSKAPRTQRSTTSPGTIQHPTPPPPPPSQMSSPPSGQNCRRRKRHNNRTKRCPRHHHHQPHKKAPAQSPSPTPSPQWSSPHSTAPPRTATGFGTCHGNRRSTTAHSDGTKSHRGSRPSASTRSLGPPPPWHYRQAAATSFSPSKGMPQSDQRRETP